MIAKRTANDLIYLVALSLFTFIWLYPLIEPTRFVLPAIPSILASARIRGWLANSLIVSTSHTLLQMLLCIGAAYALARIPFKGRQIVWLAVLSGFMVPEQATFLPIYLLFSDLELHNTHLALILPGVASPIAVFLLTQFFRNIPADLDDAARMDGATHLDILRRILLPLSTHVLAIIALYSFMANWNNYLWPLVSATKEEMWTITIALTKLVRTSGLVGAVTAAWLAGLPIMALFLVFQKRIFSGIRLYSGFN